MKVYFDLSAEESIGKYYENYNYTKYGGTDLSKRANNYRTIVNTLSNIEHYLDQTFINNGRNHIKINNIATVEYEITNDKSLIVVKNIYFNENNFIHEDVQKSLNFMQRLLEIRI